MKLGLLKDQYLVSIIAISGVAALCFPFTDWIGYRSVALLLLLTVSILAMRLSLYPVLLAATMSALIWDFFFIPPLFTFVVNSQEDVLTIIQSLRQICSHTKTSLQQIATSGCIPIEHFTDGIVVG